MTNDDMTKDLPEEIMDRAAKYLAYQPRTRQELCRHLRERGARPEDVQRCADLMEEYHLIDDLEYARMYIESRLESGRGMARIRRELQQKGVSAFVIEDAAALLEEIPDEYEIALQQAEAAIAGEDLRSMDYADKRKLMGRISGRLVRRGYRTQTVYSAVRTAFARREEAQQDEE